MDFIYWFGLLVLLYYIFGAVSLFVIDCDIGLAFAEKFGKSLDVLHGKVIWISGASSGIGEYLAYACAKVGAKLVISARRENELERVKKECVSRSAGKLKESDVLVLPMDVSDTKSHQELFDKVISTFGKLDILVNNAGRSQRATWEDIDINVDRELFELNVFGLVHLSRIAVKYFLTRGEGHLAVTSSIAGVVPAPFSASYTASKFAIHVRKPTGYFNSLKTEKFGKNVDVTVFCPGPTFTNFLLECFTGKVNEKYGQMTQSTDKRMTSERCGHLFAVSLANKIDEAWAAVFPIIPLCYIFTYFPNVMRKLFALLGPRYLYKLRDTRVSTKLE